MQQRSFFSRNRGYYSPWGYQNRDNTSWLTVAALAAGGMLVAGGVVLAARALSRPTRVKSRIVVNRPKHEVWSVWASLGNLPRFMRFLERVDDLGNGRSRWVARLPANGGTMEWIAEEIERVPGERIRWRTIEGDALHHGGEVRFFERGDGTTVVKLAIDLVPTESLSQAAASVLEPLPRSIAKDDLSRFKQYVEQRSVLS